jgi:hypothetical protein
MSGGPGAGATSGSPGSGSGPLRTGTHARIGRLVYDRVRGTSDPEADRLGFLRTRCVSRPTDRTLSG